jgi:hypothetical protein
VYEYASPATSLYNIAEDIVKTYWILGYIGKGFGKQNPANYVPSAYLAQYLIDDVNVSGTAPATKWTVGTTISSNNGLIDTFPTKLFDIWSACDTSWQYDGGTVYSNSNTCDVTMEMFSYYILAAALTKDYDKFCKFHRFFYYMLYVQNWTSDGVSKMGDANTPTYNYNGTYPSGLSSTSSYSNRIKEIPNPAGGNSLKYPFLYSSYCAGYQPYANFYGKVDVNSVYDGTSINQPIYIMTNPYYKGNNSNDILSASDADFNICFAYQIAANNVTTGWTAWDSLADSTNTLITTSAKRKVGADRDITWEYMYTQIKNTILSETGGDILYGKDLPTGSNFSPGSILPGGEYNTADPYIVTSGHDTNQYSNTFHPDYIDLALFQDFINDATAACFLEGTKILTSRGYVPVEALTKEDQLVSYGDILENKFHERDLRVVPIRWVGKYSKSKPSPRHQPICITKDALSVGMPFQDVYVSGNHGVVLRKKRVPAKRLMGDKIYKMPFERVVYYHVEVVGHQVISANGLLTETYLDVGKRKAFTTVF